VEFLKGISKYGVSLHQTYDSFGHGQLQVFFVIYVAYISALTLFNER